MLKRRLRREDLDRVGKTDVDVAEVDVIYGLMKNTPTLHTGEPWHPLFPAESENGDPRASRGGSLGASRRSRSHGMIRC